VVSVRRQKSFGCLPSAVAQHGEEGPFRVKLGRVAEIEHDVAGDAVNTHVRPSRTLVVGGVSNLAEKSDHPQLLQEHGVEGDFIETVENLARGAQNARSFDRIDLHKNGVLRIALAYQRRNGWISRIAAVPIWLAIDHNRLEQSG